MRQMKIVSALRIIALLLMGPTCARGLKAFADWVRHDQQNQGVIVFVHGVLGDGRGTWTSTTGAYWPEMLTHDRDFDGQNIYVFDYRSPKFAEAFTLDELADNMRTVLNADGVLQEDQLMFVSHSMGGIVTRAFLLRNRDLSKKIRFLYFFGTPTNGNSWASVGDFFSLNPQFGEILPIKQDGDRFLPNLVSEWHSADFTFRSFCAYETGKVQGQIVVDMGSATALCAPITPIGENHFNMVKPKDRRSDSYLALKEAFDETKLLKQPRSDDSNLLPKPKPAASKSRMAPKESLADRTFDLGEEIERWMSKRTVIMAHNSEEQDIFRQEIAEYHRLFDSRVLAITDQLESCQVSTEKIKAEVGWLGSSINLVPISGVAFELKVAANAIPEGQPRCGTGQPIQGFGAQKTGFYYLEIGASSSGAFKRDLQKGRKSANTVILGDSSNAGRKIGGYSSTVSIYLNGEVLCVDATIGGGIGSQTINVICNRADAPPGLDTNYSDKAIEVVNASGQPMLQIVFEDARHVRVNAVIPIAPFQYAVYTPSGVTRFSVDPNKPSLVEIPLKPLFRYPGWQHRGEFAN